MNVQRLPQCHWWKAFQNYLLSTTLLIQGAVPSIRCSVSKKTWVNAKTSSVLLMNSLLKTIFCLKWSYRLNQLNLPENLRNDCLSVYIFLVQDDYNEALHDFLGHFMPLSQTLESHDVDSIMNGTIEFIRSRWFEMRYNMTFLSCDTTAIRCHIMLLVLVSTSGDTNDINVSNAFMTIEMKCNITFLVMRCH